MHQRRKGRGKQQCGKSQGEPHVFEKCFINLGRVIQKNACNHLGLHSLSLTITVLSGAYIPKAKENRLILGTFPIILIHVKTIDDLDRRILRELQRDAGLSLDTLGEKVGLSRNACWRRIGLLEETGIIRSRVALLDPVKLGYGLTVFIQIRTNAHAADWLKTFSSATRSIPEITGVYRMSGDLDYLIKAHVADMADYDRVYQQLIRKVPLSDVSASFVMEEIKHTTELPL